MKRCEVTAERSLLTCTRFCIHISWYNTIWVLPPCGCNWIAFWKNSSEFEFCGAFVWLSAGHFAKDRAVLSRFWSDCLTVYSEHGMNELRPCNPDNLQSLWHCIEGISEVDSIDSLSLSVVFQSLLYLISRQGLSNCGFTTTLDTAVVFLRYHVHQWVQSGNHT